MSENYKNLPGVPKRKPAGVAGTSDDQMRAGDKTLESRGRVYGPYKDGLVIRENIIAAIFQGYKKHHGQEMPRRQQSYFFDIANKLCRLAVTPTHEDSWNDIRGYAKLIRDDVMKGPENAN